MFQIATEGFKIHWSQDSVTADKVADNLRRRYGVSAQVSYYEKDKVFWWDPGGSLFTSDPHDFVFELPDGLTLCVRSQHWGEFKSEVRRVLNQDYASRKYDSQFYKLHGYVHIICMTEEQKNELLRQIESREVEYDNLAESTNTVMLSVFNSFKNV